MRFDCYLIGGKNLLIECGEILLRRGHHIHGVVTSDPSAIRWAANHGIPTVEARGNFQKFLSQKPFHYLFSMAHLAVLPEDILAMPQKAAINFHDGPLPQYAGLNTPNWAILNGETEHGVAWHYMTEGLDQGRILIQQRLDLAADETALSLNTRCFELGIETFSRLVSDLELDTLSPQTQDPSQYRYFSRRDRPDACCVLDWQKSAAHLERLVRALHCGDYDKPLGMARLVHQGRLVEVRRAEARPGSAPPGLVLSVDGEILVGTRDGLLGMWDFGDLNGMRMSVSDVLSFMDLAGGSQLERQGSAQLTNLTRLNTQLAGSESFWIRRLSRLQPLAPPFSPVQAEAGSLFNEWELPVPQNFQQIFPQQDALLCAFSQYLALLCGETRFHVGFAHPGVANMAASYKGWLYDRVPMLVKMEPYQGFHANLSQFRKEVERVVKRGPVSTDLPGRFPALPTLDPILGGGVFSVSLALVEQGQDYQPQKNDRVCLVVEKGRDSCRLLLREGSVSREWGESALAHLKVFLTHLAQQPDRALALIPFLEDDERNRILQDWNPPETHYPQQALIHEVFQDVVQRRSHETALVWDGETRSYGDLNNRANQLACALTRAGLGAGDLVGICLPRTGDLPAAVLGVLKAGAAWLPLDPAYPKERLDYMIKDAGVQVVIAAPMVGFQGVTTIDVDNLTNDPCPNPPLSGSTSQRAYVIYTSGSTGKPKGVVVRHRNVMNFFTAMDPYALQDPPGCWLAVTSLSFDISIMELLWTLCRGFKVVLYQGTGQETTPDHSRKPMDFGLFYFSANSSEDGEKYKLLMDGARFADENGFNAVWTPERHFHEFGGLYPAPAVTGAAVAAITSRVRVRSGSVVLPLHHPVRVAESWAVVDNLSNGRVDLALAAGWQPNDFLLMPQNYKDAKGAMVRDIGILRKLWRGQSVAFPGPLGEDVSVTTLPRPIQEDVPLWITVAGNPETYRLAGELGANVLTHLLGQSIEELIPKLEIYRAARKKAGYDPDGGVITLMLHTFVGPDDTEVKRIVREPMKAYLRSTLHLLKKYAWSFPAFNRPEGVDENTDDSFAHLSTEEHEAILDHAFERYYVESGLFGSPQTCLKMVNALKAIGVGEIACLVDFGAPTQAVLDHLPHLSQLRELANPVSSGEDDGAQGDSLSQLVRRLGVTHLQCTPSMARMFMLGRETKKALAAIPNLFIGGEAFPSHLARDLKEAGAKKIVNMYGPTETTIWSSAHVLEGAPDPVPIGSPVANNSFYLLDSWLQPLPPETVGEVFIGGDGVTGGYLNRPGLTAARFLPNPFSRKPGGRMYRCGDMGRHNPNGVMYFAGRVDHQVKIRGHRIEPGEIEARLNQHPQVRESVVMTRTDAGGDGVLAAWLVADGAPTEDQLRDWLRETLPSFMMPSSLMVLDAFPLTPNRKIDRNALPEPTGPSGSRRAPYAPPRNELESRLTELWKTLLGREKIGVDDNFFDSGGHSLLAVRMHRQLENITTKPLALTDLYQYTTIRTLAGFLGRGDNGSQLLQKSLNRARKRRAALRR